MPSKAALAFREKSLATLRLLAGDSGLLVRYDGGKFVVTRAFGSGHAIMCKARFEVVAAYIRGYVAGMDIWQGPE